MHFMPFKCSGNWGAGGGQPNFRWGRVPLNFLRAATVSRVKSLRDFLLMLLICRFKTHSCLNIRPIKQWAPIILLPSFYKDEFYQSASIILIALDAELLYFKKNLHPIWSGHNVGGDALSVELEKVGQDAPVNFGDSFSVSSWTVQSQPRSERMVADNRFSVRSATRWSRDLA